MGGEDQAAIAERDLLERNGNELLCLTRHNDEMKTYSVWDKAAFFRVRIYSHRTEQEIKQAVEQFKPEVAFVDKDLSADIHPRFITLTR